MNYVELMVCRRIVRVKEIKWSLVNVSDWEVVVNLMNPFTVMYEVATPLRMSKGVVSISSCLRDVLADI